MDDEHKQSEIGELKSFAIGLNSGIEAVKNAVAYDSAMVLWKEQITNSR